MVWEIIRKDIYKRRWVILVWLALLAFYSLTDKLTSQVMFQRSSGSFMIFFSISLLITEDRNEGIFLITLPFSRKKLFLAKLFSLFITVFSLQMLYVLVYFILLNSGESVDASIEPANQPNWRSMAMAIPIMVFITYLFTFKIEFFRTAAVWVGFLVTAYLIQKQPYGHALLGLFFQPVNQIIIGLVLIIMFYIRCDKIELQDPLSPSK